MNVIVGYENNVTLSYSLNAFNSWEGYQIAFNGTRGRIEHSIVEKVYVNGTDVEQGGVAQGGNFDAGDSVARCGRNHPFA